jgi:hypothetical protein
MRQILIAGKGVSLLMYLTIFAITVSIGQKVCRFPVCWSFWSDVARTDLAALSLARAETSDL